MSYFPPTGSVVGFQSDPTKLLTHASVSGNVTLNPTSVAVLQGTNPWTVTGFPTTQNVSGSVFAVGSITALQGTNPFIVQLTSGSVITTGGNSSVQVVGLMPPQSVSGVGIFNVAGSVFAVGSVTALQGTNPFIVQLTSGSVITTGGNSSVQVVGVLPNTSVSGVGIFNVNHTGIGSIFTGLRNDALASTLGVDLTSRLVATDSAGRTITKPFAPEESRVYGVGSTVNTNPSSLLAVSGAGLRNYVTDIIMANTGTATTLVSFRDGDASIIGKAIVPAGGGSNIISFATPMRTHALNSQVEYTATTATSILHVTAFGFKAP